MLLFTFVILIAAANLCLGFAAAMYLGVGPKGWPAQLRIRRIKVADKHAHADSHDAHEDHSPAPAAKTPKKEPAPIAKAEPEAADDEDDAAHPLAQVLEQLARGFDHFEAELAHWDSQRRGDSLDADGLTNCAIELNGLASGYLEQLQACVAPLAAQRLADPAAVTARDEVHEATDALAQQLKMVCAELGSLQFETTTAHLAAGKLTTALMQVLKLLHETRDRLEEPLVALLGSEVHEGTLCAALQHNAQTTLLGRLYFEQGWQACESDRMTGTVGSVALLDVDNLRQVNATHGPLVARNALLAIGKMAGECLGPETVVARLLGKQFLLLLPHHAPQAAAENVERIRQQVEKTALHAGESELQLTVSAAVVVAKMEDSPTSVLKRLRSTIREAKSYGRNRTFLWEDRAPTPVVPPELNIEPRMVEL